MRQSEFKMRFDPELGRFTRQRIYGEGITDMFKSFGNVIFGKTMKKTAKKGVEKAVTAASTKTGKHVGKKAGEKIVQMLRKEKVAPPTKYLPLKKKSKQKNDSKRDKSKSECHSEWG